MRDEAAGIVQQPIRIQDARISLGLARARSALVEAGFCGQGPQGAGDPEVNAIDAALIDLADLAHLRSFVAKLNDPANASKYWTEIMAPDERAAVDRALDCPMQIQRAGFEPAQAAQ